ncbi:MAG: hypothetical protein HQL96_14510 [Magnetococcales bacterium]|nr:hypothetical protein [Magnetococcales bacterium]
MLATAGLRIDQAPPMHLPFRFFATAPVFTILTGCALLWFGQELLITPLLPVSIGVVHLSILGWLLMIVMGAMFQMIPVVAGIPVTWLAAIPWIHALLTVGAFCMFLGVGLEWQTAWMAPAAQAALMGAVVGFLVLVTRALLAAPARHPTVNAMRLAMAALAATLLLGVTFLWEYTHGFLDLDRHALVGMHLTWGLLGVMGVLIMGVSWQVLPMFYMTPEFPSAMANRILAGMAGLLILMPVALLLALPDRPWLIYPAAVPGVAAVWWFGVGTWRMLAGGKRKVVDVTLRHWRFGFLCAVLSLGLLALWPLLPDDSWRLLFGILYLFGWIASVMTGMLHKIVPFLVWFHRFSPLAGLREIPMMDDLSPERAVQVQWYLHVASVLLLVLAVPTEWAWAARLAGAAMVATGGLSGYALWFALRNKPPAMPEMPDFASFFKDLPPPPAPAG